MSNSGNITLFEVRSYVSFPKLSVIYSNHCENNPKLSEIKHIFFLLVSTDNKY